MINMTSKGEGLTDKSLMIESYNKSSSVVADYFLIAVKPVF